MSAEPRWNVITHTAGKARASRAEADSDRNPARALSVIALASIAAGAINLTAGPSIASDNAQNLTFFLVSGSAQVVWGAVALFQAPRWWLWLGAAGNLLVAGTWVVSRTSGLPFGEYAGKMLPARFPDTLATIFEVAVVVGAATLAIGGRNLARSAARSLGVTVVAAVVVGALGLSGVLAQAGAIGSSSAGSSHAGSGGSGGAGNSGGGGSGGGTSGGGSGGGGGYGY